MTADGGAAIDHLPLRGSPEFEAQRAKLISAASEKFIWVAQQDGMVRRSNPLKQTYKDYAFNRVCRVQYSLQYRMPNGQRKYWFPTVQELLGVFEEGGEIPLKVVDCLDFVPGGEEITFDEDGTIVLNLWQPPPWQLDPKAEAPQLFLEHLAYLFDGDQAAIEHVLNWIAHLVQRPAERIDHALLITSEAKGIGKSTLGRILRRLVGEKNARIAQTKDLKSQFDGWLAGKLFIQVDEVYETGNWELANKLKSLITEPVVGVNIKYGPQIEINNYARLLMFSNHTAPLNLEDGDRRYFVFNSQAEPRSDDYYDELHREIMTTTGMMTQAKQEIVQVSRNPLSEYIAQATASGHLCGELGREFSWDALVRLLQRDGFGTHSKNQKEVGQALKAAGVVQIRPTREGNRLRLFRLPDGACQNEKEPMLVPEF